MSLRLPEPGTFEQLLRPVRLSRYPATEPYWSARVYRTGGPQGTGPEATSEAEFRFSELLAIEPAAAHVPLLPVQSTWLGMACPR